MRTKTIIKTEKGEPNPVVEKEIISDTKCFSPVTKGTKTKPGLITLSQKHDIRLGKNIAFDLDSEVGAQLITYFDDNIPSGAINIVEKDNEIKKYIFGVVNKVTTTKGRKSHYQIAWNYSSKQLYPVDLKDELVDIARNLYLSLKKKANKEYSEKKRLNVTDGSAECVFSPELIKMLAGFHPDDMEGDAIESDDEMDDEINEEMFDREFSTNYHTNEGGAGSELYNQIRYGNRPVKDIEMLYCPNDNEINLEEEIDGLNWEINKNLAHPSGVATLPPTNIKYKYRNKVFRNELDSLLAFLPLRFWLFHLNECNRFVSQELKAKNKNKFYGVIWKIITLDELMIFYAILMQMACRPFRGKSYTECWQHTKDWFPNCKHLDERRFKQIRASLHWTNNETSCKDEDTLYKVRSMINILEETIGKYLSVGDNVALDETCIGMYHSMAKAFIYYNASKPRGKHHCKLYALCENNYWALINFKFCHRSYNDNGDVDNDGDLSDSENEYEIEVKMNKHNKKNQIEKRNQIKNCLL